MANPIVARRGLVVTYLHRPTHVARRPRRRRPLHMLPVPVRPQTPMYAVDWFQHWLVRAAVILAAFALLAVAARFDAAAAVGAAAVIHPARHRLAGQTVKLRPAAECPDFEDGALYRVEDWWDRVYGGSWMWANGNPAALNYAFRAGLSRIPHDDEVLYGKTEDGRGHLVHVSELVEPSTEEKA